MCKFVSEDPCSFMINTCERKKEKDVSAVCIYVSQGSVVIEVV